MTPDEVARHPSVLAACAPGFDASAVPEFSAACAACGRTAFARGGARVERPCGRPPGVCAFLLAVPADAPAWADTLDWWGGVELRGAADNKPSGGRVPRARLVPPPAPRGAAEWLPRWAAVGALSPGLARAVPLLPVGWFGALEMAAHALDARGLGHAFALGQAKEKWGSARLHLDPPPGAARGDARFRAACEIASWGALLTRTLCARDGTPDGRLGQVGAWWLVLGDAAWRDVEASEGRRDRRREVLDLYPEWARPPAEEDEA